MLKDLAKLSVSAALIGLLLWHIGFEEVWKRLQQIPVWVITAFAILLWLQIWIGAVRWAMVAAAIGTPIGNRVASLASFVGFFFSQTLPSAYGGDVYRVYATTRAGTSIGSALASVLLDRLLGLAALALIMIAGLPWLATIVPSSWLQGIIWLTLLAIATALTAAALGRRGAIRAGNSRLLATVAEVWAAWRVLCARPRPLAIAGSLAILAWGLNLGSTWLLALGLGIPLSLFYVLLLVPPIRLAMAVPVTIAGWGIREGAFVAMLGLVGVASQDGFALGFATGLLTSLSSLPGVILWLAIRNDRADAA